MVTRKKTHRDGVMLTVQQAQILEAVSRGESRSEIASRFDVSLSTVSYHLSQIEQRLHVPTSAAAVMSGPRRLVHSVSGFDGF